MPYRPTMPKERQELLRRWHEAALHEMRQRGDVEMSYLGRTFLVPQSVFAPTPVSDVLGNVVLDETHNGDRVLDMGTGCGVNAILAASKSHDVTGVDINAEAITVSRVNAERNGVVDRTAFLESDVFSAVQGRFDLIVFDPPFRWFRPRDLLEAGIADEDYGTLTRLMEQAADHLAPAGRILLFFGTSGDTDYLTGLIRNNGFVSETVRERRLSHGEPPITYSTQRLRRR